MDWRLEASYRSVVSAQAKTIRGLDAPIWTTLTPATQDERDSQVRIQWLGTAGFRISYQGFVVLIAPYVTRASLGRCVTSPLWTDVVAVDRYIDKADAITLTTRLMSHLLPNERGQRFLVRVHVRVFVAAAALARTKFTT